MSEYIIEFRDKPSYQEDNIIFYPCKQIPWWSVSKSNIDKLTPLDKALEEAYQRGLDDAWEAAKKIFGYEIDGGIPIDELRKVFGYAEDAIFCTADIIRHNTASEAIAKLKAYEEKQKEDEIKVGDEVAFHHDDGRPDTVVVVTYIGKDGFIDGMDGRGTQYAHKNPTKWTKTGRHFNIDKILEEMRHD